MRWEDLKQGMRVRATDGVMKERAGTVMSFGVFDTLAGTKRQAVSVKFDDIAPVEFATNAEWLEEE